MKDLYTFDINSRLALATYHEVRGVYADLFDELKISYLVAEADSGNMGGNLSHEFHFPTPKGEDHVISCQKCDYVANEELAEAAISIDSEADDASVWSFANSDEETVRSPPLYSVWRGISRDRKTLVNVWYSLADGANNPEINTHAVKAVVPELDAGVENAASVWTQSIVTAQPEGAPAEMCIVNLIDNKLPISILDELNSSNADPSIALIGSYSPKVTSKSLVKNPATGKRLNLLRIRDGDQCPRCEDGLLKVQKAIELGHTFFLGTRYSEPLEALVTLPAGYSDPDPALAEENVQHGSRGQINSSSDIQVPMQMGCHGIGVSRMIGAVAETLVDEKGLNWPRVIAPYEVVVIPTKTAELEAGTVYDALTKDQQVGGLDVVIDDTPHSFAWKMNDADLIGYPVIVVLGKRWKKDQTCEVQCRRLGIKEHVSFPNLHAFVASLLARL
jgi:prolyl-tRNA synthetase